MKFCAIRTQSLAKFIPEMLFLATTAHFHVDLPHILKCSYILTYD